jgi:hypothetical protein
MPAFIKILFVETSLCSGFLQPLFFDNALAFG